MVIIGNVPLQLRLVDDRLSYLHTLPIRPADLEYHNIPGNIIHSSVLESYTANNTPGGIGPLKSDFSLDALFYQFLYI